MEKIIKYEAPPVEPEVKVYQTSDILTTVIPFVQEYKPGNKKGKNGEDKKGIDYSTWEDVTLYDCILGRKAQGFKESNEYFRANFSKEKDKDAYTQWKVMNGIMCYPGIICDKHSVKGDNVKAPSGIMSIDVDKQDNEEIFADPELLDITLRSIQAWIPYVFAMTKSVGTGYVFYAYVEVPGNNFNEWNTNNKIIYEKVKQDFKNHGLVIDAACGNLNRARFISYDDKPWINPSFEKLVLEESEFKTRSSHSSDDDLDKHVTINNWSIDGFTITRPMDYKDWWRVWKNMECAFGNTKGQEEFRRFCYALEKANTEHDWPHQHSAEHIFSNATAKYECKEQWKLDVELLRSIGYTIDASYTNDILTLRESFENNIHVVPQGQYLTDYKKDVIDFWQEHKVMMLVGTTGLGKTELIKWISHYKKVVVIVPYNDMLTIYTNGDIVKGISEILDSATVNDFDGLKSACIIWDQFPKILNKMDGYSIIIDECHVVGKSIFRKSSTNLVGILKDRISNGVEVMFVTATPTYEQQVYNIPDDAIVQFDRQGYIRPIEICYNFVDEYEGNTVPGKASTRIKGDVMYNSKTGRFDYILIWSDMYNKVLSDHFRLNYLDVYQVNKAVANYDETVRNNIEELKGTQLLHKGVYTFTQLTENGFNFNNREGKALVIIHVNESDFSYAKVVQIVGRLRFLPYVYVKVYVEHEVEHELTPEDKYVRSHMSNTYDINISNDPLYEDIRVVENDNINRAYELIHGHPDKLKDDLEGYLKGGKFKVTLHDMSEEKGLKRLNNNVKREEEKKAWEDIKQGVKPESVYGKIIWYSLQHLGDMYGRNEIIQWVDILLGKAKSDKLVSTCLNELRGNLPWTNEEWSVRQRAIINQVLENKKFKDADTGEELVLSERLIKHIWKDMNNHIRWADTYKDCISIKEMVARSEVVTADEIDKLFEKRSEAHSIKHKQHKQHTFRGEDGFEGTRNECLTHYSIGATTFTKWKKTNKLIQVT